MVELPSKPALTEALAAAAVAHHDYEQNILKSVRDELWPGFYAAYVLGRLGDFVSASRLASLLAEVDARWRWSQAAAEHVLVALAESRGRPRET